MLTQIMASWENSNESGEVIVEYMNEEGTYIVHVASKTIVDFVPNPLNQVLLLL